MKLTMRELKGTDIFTIMNLMNKLDIINPIKELLGGDKREEILAMFKDDDIENQEEQLGLVLGIDIASLVIERLPKAQNDINQFLATLCKTELSVIEELSILEYVGLIKDFFGHSDLKAILSSIFSSTDTKKTKKK